MRTYGYTKSEMWYLRILKSTGFNPAAATWTSTCLALGFGMGAGKLVFTSNTEASPCFSITIAFIYSLFDSRGGGGSRLGDNMDANALISGRQVELLDRMRKNSTLQQLWNSAKIIG
jgi:hypothetical protein